MVIDTATAPRLKAAIFNGAETAQTVSIRLDGPSGYHKMAYVKRGTGHLMLEGKTQGFGPNSLIFIPDHTPHRLSSGLNAHMTVFAISSTAQVPLPVDPVLVPMERSVDISAINQLFDTAFHELNSGDEDALMAVESYIGLITVHMNRILKLRTAETLSSDASARLMRRFAYAVEEKFNTGATLEEIARDLEVTPTHLTRVCQSLNSQSASHYLQARIFGEAKHRLLESSERIQTIAEQLGFTSAAYFSRFFQAKMGKSPKDYRKYVRELMAGIDPMEASWKQAV